MRPTGRKWLGHEKRHCVNSASERIARRCGMLVFDSLLKDSERSGTRRCLSLSNMSRLVLRSQDDEGGRDYRTQPGVLTPGTVSKSNPPQRGGRRIAGLSLIELLVVLTIIAAISALITTSVLSALKQQNQRICFNNMLTIEAAKDEYIRDRPGSTTIDQNAFQQYFRFGIPTCPDRGVYNNLYNLSEQVSCSIHGKIPVSPSPTP
jgi:prepilin-type N-terminal cleavage/methylation domain-containing protein